ncbi:MAG: 3-isopropylmalate dehydrogenase, partial [Ruminococcaceae bacterium]|nr:3-isopropylmalate dehydrogenase [Oscillospiraceae bacterium]
LIGGVYFGEHKTEEVDGIMQASDLLIYNEKEIERICRIGFETAQKRRKKLCSVEKSNVLDSSRLWKKVVHKIASDYPDVELTDMLVDNCAMQIVKDPSQFDVIVTENMFGDILSDEASMITGSIGMIPSSSLGSTTCGVYEPIHGSAPDIAGKDIANPIGTILSAAMMLRFSFNMEKEADSIENAVSTLLNDGYRTADIMPSDVEEAKLCKKIGCRECGKLIAERIK